MSLAGERPAWQAEAACAGHPEPWLWFPGRGESDGEARSVCLGCPVAGPCFDHALHYERFGIWAGTSERQRRAFRRQRGIALIEISPIPEPEEHPA